MAALPTTSSWFPASAEVVVNGTAHLLLLNGEHAPSVTCVHNLLRETYHSVALLDTDVREPGYTERIAGLLLGAHGARFAMQAPMRLAGQLGIVEPSARFPRPPRLRAAAALKPPSPTQQPPALRRSTRDVIAEWPPFSAPSASSAHVLSARSGSAQAATLSPDPSGPRVANVTVLEQLHADRLHSDNGIASEVLTTSLLATSLAEARVRQTIIMQRLVIIAVPVCIGTLSLFLSTFAATDAGRQCDGAEAQSCGGTVAFERVRIYLLTLGFGVSANTILLCFRPTTQQRLPVLISGLFGLSIILIGTVPFATTFLRVLPRLSEDWAPGGPRAAGQLSTFLEATVQVITFLTACTRALVLLWHHRASAQRMLAVLWSTLVLTFSGIALAHTIAFVKNALTGFVPVRSDDTAPGSVRAFFIATPVAFNAFYAFFAGSPRLQRRAQALAARPGSGTACIVASLAPLLGFGSSKGERDATELHAEARLAMRGVLLDERGLDAVGAAWAVAETRRRAVVAATATAGDFAAVRWLRRVRRSSIHARRRSVMRLPRHSSADDDDAWDAAPLRQLPTANSPTAQYDEQLAALARVHTRHVDSYDCYVVHCESDNAAAKIGALRRFCKQFWRSTGRWPLAFVSTLCDPPLSQQPRSNNVHPSASSPASLPPARNRCAPVTPQLDFASGAGGSDAILRVSYGESQEAAQPSRRAQPSHQPSAEGSRRGEASRAAARSLEHTPVRLARSSQLVVLASAPLFERLWCALEVFVWRLTGGGEDTIHALPVAANEREGGALLAAVDTFHVMVRAARARSCAPGPCCAFSSPCQARPRAVSPIYRV